MCAILAHLIYKANLSHRNAAMEAIDAEHKRQYKERARPPSEWLCQAFTADRAGRTQCPFRKKPPSEYCAKHTKLADGELGHDVSAKQRAAPVQRQAQLPHPEGLFVLSIWCACVCCCLANVNELVSLFVCLFVFVCS
jgi:hypothetical protein